MVLKNAPNAFRAQAECQRVKVANVDDEVLAVQRQHGIQGGAQDRGGGSIHHDQRRGDFAGGFGDRGQSGEGGRNLRGRVGKRAQPVFSADALIEVIKAETPVRYSRRRGAVVKDGYRYGIQAVQRKAKRGQRIAQRDRVEIRHVQSPDRIWQAPGFILTDQLDSHSGYRLEVIVERFGGFRGGENLLARLKVSFNGPGSRAAAHGDAREQNAFLAPGGFTQAPVDDHGRRGHDQLEPVFQIQAGIIQEDILRAGADING